MKIGTHVTKCTIIHIQLYLTISFSGEEMVINENAFIEKLLPAGILRPLTPDEMSTYKDPFKDGGESRRPCLTWSREIPISSEGPDDIHKVMSDYNKWLRHFANDVPKLYINAEPGFFAPIIKEKVKDIQNVKTVTVKGHHFVPEDSPEQIGKEVAHFIEKALYKL